MTTRMGTSVSSGDGVPATRKKLPPYPMKQLLILALCRISEPIAFMSIFPYIYHMVKDFNITEDENQISFYAGMVTSAFTFAECSTSFFWGRLSDKVGRKPVLISGLAGTGLSVLIFGFAPNLAVALFARALGGFLNGVPLDIGADNTSNIGVLQTTIGEMVTVKEHQPRAYSVMPNVWCLGSIVGPMIGGALAKPVETLPSLFSPGSIWERFPYLLPNLFSACCVFIGVIIGVLFLEETHAEKKRERDRGLEFGRYLLSHLPGNKVRSSKGKEPEEQPLLFETDEPLPGYLTNDGARNLASQDSVVLRESLDLEAASQGRSVKSEKKPGKVLTRSVILIIISYGILAFHTMTFDALLPVFLSTNVPDEKKVVSLPFRFADGFGYDTKTIGIILSVQGIYSMASTSFLFPPVTLRLGALRLFRFVSIAYPLLYLTTPYTVLLPDGLRMMGVYALIVLKCTYATLAYPSNAILLTNSAPTTLSLGSINGVAACTASLARACGPAVSGYLYTLGLDSGYSGLAWWATGLVTVAGAYISCSIPEPRGRLDEKEDVAEPAAPSAQVGDPLLVASSQAQTVSTVA
ncbi:major facilitator superfamily domain-containing protein [Apodospora peruviana]|uniref:Major facilitator superfamily domain-containing protein n=1 Tax=Apodospora peruviana TaxID=516989 RepID=A0AAE0I4W5_9PEZI|nr:major facilitator superfamily domain-containing protein [Apodospora peruviana]